ASDEIEIEWTLTFVTEVDPRDACDYTRSGIDAVFRPHELMRTIYPDDRSGKAKIVHVRRDAAEIQHALARGWRVSEQPPAHSQWRAFRRESDLRLEGKWE